MEDREREGGKENASHYEYNDGLHGAVRFLDQSSITVHVCAHASIAMLNDEKVQTNRKKEWKINPNQGQCSMKNRINPNDRTK